MHHSTQSGVVRKALSLTIYLMTDTENILVVLVYNACKTTYDGVPTLLKKIKYLS